jgi:phosphoglycerol transferase MdoB-like AlkP superfamily enzyme
MGIGSTRAGAPSMKLNGKAELETIYALLGSKKGEEMEEKKHSGLGIASFIISIISGILVFFLLVIAGVMEVSTPGGIDENSAGAIILGMFLIALMFVSLVALGLGIGGLLHKERKRIFAILGTVFSLVVCLG